MGIRRLLIFAGLLSGLCGCKDDPRPADAVRGSITGETLAFSGEQPTRLYKQDRSPSHITLYGRTVTGRVTYRPGIDYAVSESGIRRTEGSSIPDCANHRVRYNADGSFTWSADPPNPEPMDAYQVYADYQYLDDGVVPADATAGIPSLIASRAKARGELRLVCVGTSISYGGDTFARKRHDSDSECYWRLAANALGRLYGVPCRATDFSVPGGGSEVLAQKMDQVIGENPDVTLIEFGINDHLFPQGAEQFERNLDAAVRSLRERGIGVVLIGFFQQNKAWDLETPENTILYNGILKSVAAGHDIPFVDIYGRFAQTGYPKTVRDLLADYIHHPTSFGHQLYYLSLMSALAPRPMTERELFECLRRP